MSEQLEILSEMAAKTPTLRDYFAAQMLPALFAALIPKDAARVAYEYADAMLAARGDHS